MTFTASQFEIGRRVITAALHLGGLVAFGLPFDLGDLSAHLHLADLAGEPHLIYLAAVETADVAARLFWRPAAVAGALVA